MQDKPRSEDRHVVSHAGHALLISVIVPTHRRAAGVRELLRSLETQSLSRDEFEILVISNFEDRATSDAVAAFSKKFPHLSFQVAGEPGVNASRNLGLAKARAPIALFLDDDCRLMNPQYLKRLLQLHGQLPGATAIGGRYTLGANADCVVSAYHEAAFRWMNPPARGLVPTWRLVGGNVSYKIKELGDQRFDPSIRFGGAESELHSRLEWMGALGVLHADLNVVHECKMGFLELLKKALYQGMSAARRPHPRATPPALSGACASDLSAVGFVARAFIAIYMYLFARFFTVGQDFKSQATVGEMSVPLFLHCLKTAPLELIFSKRFRGDMRGRLIRLGWRLQRTYVYSQQLAIGGYWLIYRSWRWLYHFGVVKSFWRGYRLATQALLFLKLIYWRLADVYWRLSDVYWFLYAWHWRVRGPIQGVFIRLGGGQRVFRYGWQFIRFCIEHFHLEGSKTSRFLHRLWRSRTTFPDEPALFIPSVQGEPEARRLAEISRRFGFTHLAVGDEILDRDWGVEFCRDLRQSGCQVEVFYRPHELESDRIAKRAQALRAIDCRLTPLFRKADLDEFVASDAERLPAALRGRIAVSPDVGLEDLEKVERLRQNFGGAELVYVDLFHQDRVTTKAAYELACHIATREELIGSWKLGQLFQPFYVHDLSVVRFLEGRLRWTNRTSRNAEWSIVIPCFEHCEYLPLVIDHILKQHYETSKIEIIIVDDGSTLAVDETLVHELEALRASEAALKVVRLERDQEGAARDTTFRAGVARNAGILHATGKKILFLDSDILLTSGHLHDLDEALKNADVVQSVRQMLKEEKSSASTQADALVVSQDTYPEDVYWEKFKSLQDWNGVSAPWKYVCTYALAVTRESLSKVKMFRPEFCEYGFEDTEMGFRLFRLGLKFHLLKSPVFHLFPVKRSFALHFDENARFEALCQTAQLFHRMHCDPSIYYELRSLMTERA